MTTAKQFKHLNSASALRQIALDEETEPKKRAALLKIALWNVWESARLRKEMGVREEIRSAVHV